MNWKDTGYLLSKNQYNENSVIAEVYTEFHGKISGIIFGATSKKIKNYLQVGNKLHLNFNYKNDNRLGHIKVEIVEALSPLFFDNKKKLACIISSMNLIKILTVEEQENINIYKLIDDFFIILKQNYWLKNFIFWELQLFKLIGYDLEIDKIVDIELIDGKKKYFVESNKEKKFIPNFLVERDSKQIDNNSLINGLKLVGDYLEKSILRPNNITFPISRVEFVKIMKL